MMQDNEMMMDSGPMGWMMGGMGIGAVLVLAILVLGVFALVKYLRR